MRTIYLLKKVWYAVIIALLKFGLLVFEPLLNILFYAVIGLSYKFLLSPFVQIGYQQAGALMAILMITKYFWKYENDL